MSGSTESTSKSDRSKPPSRTSRIGGRGCSAKSTLVICSDIGEATVGDVWSKQPDHIILFSAGGETDAATSIADYVKRYKTQVTITGRCFSAAVLVCACGRKGSRVATPGTMFFVHPAQYEALSGDKRTIQRERRQLTRFETYYASTLAQNTKRDLKFWREKMAAETYLTAEEALEVGLVDAVK